MGVNIIKYTKMVLGSLLALLAFIILVFLAIPRMLERGIPYAYGGKWENRNPDAFYKAPIKKDEPIIIEAQLGTKPIRLMIDTGATDSYLFCDISKMNIKKKNFPIPINYGGSRFNIRFIERVVLEQPLSIGSFIGIGIEWLVINKKDFPIKSKYNSIDGVIGRNILNNFMLFLNYNDSELYLANEESAIKLKDLQNSVTLSMNQLSIVSVRLNGKIVPMRLDTGFNDHLILYSIGISSRNDNSVEITFSEIFKDTKAVYNILNAEIEIGDLIVRGGAVYHNVSLYNIFSYRKLSAGICFISSANWYFNFKNNKVILIPPLNQ